MISKKKENYLDLSSDFKFKTVNEFIENTINNSNKNISRFFVYYNYNQEMVGFSNYTVSNLEAGFGSYRLAIPLEHRSKGYGKIMLLDTFKTAFKDKNVFKLEGKVFGHNKGSIALHEKIKKENIPGCITNSYFKLKHLIYKNGKRENMYYFEILRK